MRFFLNWIDVNSLPTGEEITKTDLDILDLVITQREGEIALCQLTVPLTSPLKQNSQAILFVEVEGKRTPLFKGKLMDLPLQINDWQQVIEFYAIPYDAKEKLAQLRDEIQQSGNWDELFIEESSRQDPVEALEATPSLFCWDPVSHAVELSDLFQGRRIRKYDETQILKDTLSIKIAGLPKPYIKVSVVAEWIQEVRGELNLFPLIEKHFNGGRINTLTAKGLISSWPRTGQILGRSGYAVVESRLAPFTPGTTGSLGLYPQMTQKIIFADEPVKSVHLKHSWFTGKLKLEWNYRQRRREITTFKLHHQNQLLQRSEFKKLDLVLNLADISQQLPSPSAPSFFETERGKKAIMHAIKIARCHLAASARGIEVSFKVPFAEAISLSMDDSIQIRHHAFHGDSATGKLVSYKLSASFEKSWAELKVAIAAGIGEEGLPTTIELDAETPLAGLPALENLNLNDFVEATSVRNQANEQLKAIHEAPPKDLNALKQLLVEHQTEVNLKLKDIRSVDVLERRFFVTTPLMWSAPSQINVEGS
ncbi:hypothetical protein [Candidatus Paracaedibacter symbiosus]|uniref:hypothetical protein n=1 Tax=Candidatus Paracaedibacter symbiosus TaxID=244582 RepID=UPI000509DC7E|nr:hypothetical protein [Candidatus Paracaedibacter symbiosus]